MPSEISQISVKVSSHHKSPLFHRLPQQPSCQDHFVDADKMVSSIIGLPLPVSQYHITGAGNMVIIWAQTGDKEKFIPNP